MTVTVDDAAVVAALDAVRQALAQASVVLENATTGVTREQAQLEAVSDAARALPGRGRDVRASLQLIHESLERAKLGALNAGLEAARVGEPLGQVVMQLSADQRDLVSRALDSLEAHAALLSEVERDRDRWLDGVTTARDAAAAVAEQLGGLSQHHQEAMSGLLRLEHDLGPVLGTDPATARLLLGLAEQVEKLGATIGALSEHADPRTAERLRQALTPLMRALGEEPRQGGP